MPPASRQARVSDRPGDLAGGHTARRDRYRGRRRDVPAGQLAQADPVPAPVRTPPVPVMATDPTAGAKSATTSRIGYDLEPVTPMPPDGRDSRDVY